MPKIRDQRMSSWVPAKQRHPVGSGEITMKVIRNPRLRCMVLPRSLGQIPSVAFTSESPLLPQY